MIRIKDIIVNLTKNKIMSRKELYDNWVDRVCRFLEETGPALGPEGRCCGTFQSAPVLDKSPDVVFLGYNPNEEYGYVHVDRDRFYKGNPYFYASRDKWKIWHKLYGAMNYVKYLTPLDDGNFVFFNAVYFGSKDIAAFKKIHGAEEAIDRCLEFTDEVIHRIFQPKCVVCFSIKDCFDLLDNKFKFNWKETIVPEFDGPKAHHVSTKSVKHGLWRSNDGKGLIPVLGIPHPSQAISNDDWGAIATWLKAEMQSFGI